ncbi:MAG: hypothetical protein OHK0012_07630 [Synechococcales cyanobacterium]
MKATVDNRFQGRETTAKCIHGDVMVTLSLLFFAGVLLVAATIAGQNPALVSLRLGWWQSVALPVGWWIMVAVGAGLVSVAGLSALVGRPRLSDAAQQLQNRLDRMESAQDPPT